MRCKIKIFLIFGITFMLAANPLWAIIDITPQEDSLQAAIQLFDTGEFEKATPVFESLLSRDSDA